MLKKSFKIVVFLLLFILAIVATNYYFMAFYVNSKFTKISPISEPIYPTNFHSKAFPDNMLLFLHKVNTPIRASKQQDRYDGFEIDILANGTNLHVAHDEKQLEKAFTLSDIFRAIKNAKNKFYWLDTKSALSSSQIDDILQTAQQFEIPFSHLFFEVPAGETASLLSDKNLFILLQIPEGFSDDVDAVERESKNNELEILWNKYKPVAIVGSFGKYQALQAYAPNMPKAIYYSSTTRPSFKKIFMQKNFSKDSSVKIFMQEAYTFL